MATTTFFVSWFDSSATVFPNQCVPNSLQKRNFAGLNSFVVFCPGYFKTVYIALFIYIALVYFLEPIIHLSYIIPAPTPF